MKSWLRQATRNLGYEIRKATSPGFKAAPIFDLAVNYLLATAGPALTFIQVGANDGKYADPLRRYILKYPWSGVLIEPQPDVFARLRSNYSGFENRVSFENVAITREPGTIPMYRLPIKNSDQNETGVHASSVASANRRVTARQLFVKSSELEQIMVTTARLDDIVAQHQLQSLDILQIDTEGYEWEALQTLDLAKTLPRIIQFEHGHLRPSDIRAMVDHLNAFDYGVYFGGHETDSVAMRSDLLPKEDGQSS